MKSLVLDTNVLIHLLRNAANYIHLFKTYDEVILPSIVVGEYKAGLFETRTGEKNRQSLADYLADPNVRGVPITDRTADIYAKVYQALRKEGTPIPQNDMWIAASALENGADLATCDEHFRHVPMLTVIVVD